MRTILSRRLVNFCLSVFLLVSAVGCGSVSYSPYIGEQRAWPVRAGAFAKQESGLFYYQTWPEKPYTILGHITVTARPLYIKGQLGAAIRKYHADGIIQISQETFQAGAISTSSGYGQGSATLTGNTIYSSGFGVGNTVTTPIYETQVSGYLFRWLTNAPALDVQPVK